MTKKLYEQKAVLYKAKAFDPLFQVKAIDDGQGIIQAYASKFGNEDEYKDIVVEGAYKRTLANQRKAARPYLYTYLYQHDPNLIVGGIKDAEEDSKGLIYQAQCNLETQLGRETYSNAKMGVLYQSSIGYDVPPGGAEFKEGIRYLKEIRLWEISLVTFAANPEATVVGVKASQRPYEIWTPETKTVSGDTSLSIGPRDEAWDGSKAKRQIFEYATDSDGEIDASKAKKCFLQVDGDTSLKGSYSYPFVYIENDSPRIAVGGVKACAGALSRSRGADTSDSDVAGMRKKVETLYARINKAYPDADPLTPPWKDDGKSMNRRRQTKTLMEHYNEEMAEDLCEDLQDVYLCSLVKAIFDAFTIGDQPEQDVSQALDDFKTLMLDKFVAQAVECDLSQYLEDNGYSYTPGLTTMLNGSDDGYGYGYMSRSTRSQQRKAGRAISAATQDIIDQHVKSVKAMAKQAKADMQAHTDAMHDAVDGMAEYGSDKSLSTLVSRKAGRALSETNANALHDMADKAMSIMQEHTKALTKAANGLAQAVKPPVSDTDGEDPMDDDTQIEKSMQDALMELKALQTV